MDRDVLTIRGFSSLSGRVDPDEIIRALGGPRLTIAETERSSFVASPGIYAVFGETPVWRQLGLGEPPDERPLYVGKAEESFNSRDLDDHFGDGRTGRSTLRRSFAALLVTQLHLVPVPRGKNPLDRTKRANMYGLTPECDARLTEWMRDSLTLTMWPCCVIPNLGNLEDRAIAALKPPLCINGKWRPNHWHVDVIEPARAEMTRIVRATP